MYTNQIGKRIKKIREEKEITQQQLAEYIDVDRTTLSHYESGARLPSIYIFYGKLRICSKSVLMS